MPRTITPRSQRGLPWGSNIVRDLAGDRYAKGEAEGFTPGGSTREAMVTAGLDWKAELGKLHVRGPGGFLEVADRWAVQRSDTGAAVGVVGNRYTPMDNVRQAEFTDLLVDTHAASLAGMGATRDGGMGTRVYTAVKLDEDLWPPGMPDEKLAVYLWTANAHDGTTAFTGTLGAWRESCVNTLHYNVKELTTTWTVRHTASLEQQLVIASDAIRAAAGWGEALVFDAQELLGIPVGANTAWEALEVILPVPDEKLDDDGKLENRRTIVAAEKRLDSVYELWTASDSLADVRTTGWGLLNAVAEYQDWGRVTRAPAIDRLLGRSNEGDPVLVRARSVIGEMA